MAPIDPHLLVLMVITVGVGLLMALSGVHKNSLEWRRQRRICPSCGREADFCSCD